MVKRTRIGKGITVNFNKKSVSTTSKSAFGRITTGKKITLTPKKPKSK